MAGLITIFVFVVLLAVPGFYIITRKVFPNMSKKNASWLTGIVTALFVALLTIATMMQHV